MISGTSQADCVILIVAACDGEFQAGMSSIGQTREHALLAFTLGIKNIIVCVNKMDNYYVNYASVVYDHVKKEVLQFLKKVGFKTETIPVIPISGWVGDNLV